MSKVKCYHCDWGRKRFEDEGVFYHSYKESNGIDYDNYVTVCEDQPADAIGKFRKAALEKVKTVIKKQQKLVALLKSKAVLIKPLYEIVQDEESV